MSEDREHWALSRIQIIIKVSNITKFELIRLHALAIIMKAFSTSYKSAIESLSILRNCNELSMVWPFWLT